VYVATAVTMGACVLQNAVYWLKNKRFEKLHLITLVSVVVLGGFTLIFHKAIFIQWKPSIIYCHVCSTIKFHCRLKFGITSISRGLSFLSCWDF
jgi:intracellular septation protein A